MIYGIYFSPTNNSKKYVEAMAKSLDVNAKMIDVTTHAQPFSFSQEDFVIIGAPVYGGRIPGVSKERFNELKGTNTPCVLVASYGNRHYDDALVEMKDLFEANGFVAYGACAVIGRHTYGEIQVDRPNQDDLNVATAFIQSVYQRALPLQTTLPGNSHEDIKQNKGNFHPLTNDTCIHCQICVQNCPVQAIEGDAITISEKCISCFRCIRNCPIQAKHMNVPAYNDFAVSFTEKLKERRENEFFM